MCPRGTTDKHRSTTTNSSSSHHHDSAPSRPHLLICTGVEPIHPVHGPRKLPAWQWPPEMRSFFCHFCGFFPSVLLRVFFICTIAGPINPVHGQPMSLATKVIPRNEVTFSPFSLAFSHSNAILLLANVGVVWS